MNHERKQEEEKEEREKEKKRADKGDGAVRASWGARRPFGVRIDNRWYMQSCLRRIRTLQNGTV